MAHKDIILNRTENLFLQYERNRPLKESFLFCAVLDNVQICWVNALVIFVIHSKCSPFENVTGFFISFSFFFFFYFIENYLGPSCSEIC